MQYLRQSTAAQITKLGPFVDDTDGTSPEVGLTIAAADIQLSKNGGGMAAKDSGGGTHDKNGWYTITFNATDTTTVGRLQVSCKVAGALAVWMEFTVLEEAIYDALFATSAQGFDSNQRVNLGRWIGTAVTLSAGVPDVNISSTDNVDLTAAQAASVKVEADLALKDIHLDHIFAVDYDPASPPGSPTAFLNELTEDDGNGEVRYTAHALSQSPASGGGFITTSYTFSTNTDTTDPGSGGVKFNDATPASVTEIYISQITAPGANIADVIEALVSGDTLLVGQDGNGANFIRGTLNGTVTDNGAWYTLPITIVDSGALIGNNRATNVSFGFAASTPTEVAAAVWNALQASFTTVGSFGEIATEIATILASTAGLAGAPMRGSDGALLEVNVPANFASMVISGAGAVDSLVQGFLGTLITETNAGDIADSFAFFYDVDPVTNKTVNDVGAAGTGAAAEVTGDLGDTPAGKDIQQWLYQLFRNKGIADSNTKKLSFTKGDGTVVLTAAFLDSGGVFTRQVYV